MNAPVDVIERRPRDDNAADTRLGIIDCDIHPSLRPGALNKYLSERWREHLAEYGKLNCGIYADRGTYPRFSPATSRRDAWPREADRPAPMSRSCASSCSTPTILPMACWSR